VRYGASPRATIYLALRPCHAFLNGRGYVTPQDVKSIGTDVLRHRVIVSYGSRSWNRSTARRSSIESSRACRPVSARDRQTPRKSQENPRAGDQDQGLGANDVCRRLPQRFKQGRE